MKMEIMQFEQAEEDIKSSEHKRVALFDKNGQQIVPFNSKNIPLEKRLHEIQKRLESKATLPGIYQIHAKHYGAKAVPSIYYVQVGEIQEALAEIELKTDAVIVTDEIPNLPQGKTAQEYWDLYEKTLRLEAQIREKDKYIEELEETIAEIPEEEEGGTGFLSDNAQEFIKGSLEQVIPLVDKMLEQRDFKLKLQALQITQGQDQIPGMSQGNPTMHSYHQGGGGQQDLAEEEDLEISDQEEQYIQAMENLRIMHPDLYAAAMEKLQEGGENAHV